MMRLFGDVRDCSSLAARLSCTHRGVTRCASATASTMLAIYVMVKHTALVIAEEKAVTIFGEPDDAL